MLSLIHNLGEMQLNTMKREYLRLTKERTETAGLEPANKDNQMRNT